MDQEYTWNREPELCFGTAGPVWAAEPGCNGPCSRFLFAVPWWSRVPGTALRLASRKFFVFYYILFFFSLFALAGIIESTRY